MIQRGQIGSRAGQEFGFDLTLSTVDHLYNSAVRNITDMAASWEAREDKPKEEVDDRIHKLAKEAELALDPAKWLAKEKRRKAHKARKH